MNISFLHRLPGLGRSPLHRIVAAGSAEAAKAEAALRYLLAELPELLLAAVVVIGSGQALASYTSQPQLGPSLAAPFWVAVVRQLQASQAAQGHGDEQVEEVLTTLPSQLHLLRRQAHSPYCFYLVVDSHDTNLALAREVLSQATGLLSIEN